MVDRLKGKVALVTGAGSAGPGWGNGKASAVLFAREGARVFAVDINGEAAEETGRRTVLLASGGMSHRFWPLPELPLHEASDPVHVRTPEARAADEERLEWLRAGDHRRVVETMDDYARFAPEGRFGHYLMAVAAAGGADCTAPGRMYSDYENAVGTGQVHVWFDRPPAGWTA